ncbi:hypothetical protein [Evansella cellulosilytica]|uniref:Geminin H-like protein n=1 Tax=Evansella cellulosilytica (strain ATCC 21833 / DSM 2522 / FERM P-1141 / JCM 9156 / N-4) TaxID=649639 RepID=E6TRB5_EVAC2|nr:hypothetical protein [Evansella cellulosilytica]ADU30627.1 geminin H-like protein [Evansella cellulosilytica DSM 2522]
MSEVNRDGNVHKQLNNNKKFGLGEVAQEQEKLHEEQEKKDHFLSERVRYENADDVYE